MSVRTPFQIFKGDFPAGTVAEFNALPPEVSTKYKIASAEGKLCVLMGTPVEQSTMTNASKASVAKGLHDLLSLVQVALKTTTKKSTSRARSKSATEGGLPIVLNYDVVNHAVQLLGIEQVGLIGASTTVEIFQQAALKAKESEVLLKKAARADPLDEPLRKSARLKELREAAQSNADVIEVSKPTKLTKSSPSDDEVTEVPPPAIAALPEQQPQRPSKQLSSSHVVPLDVPLEISCAISVVSDNNINAPDEPPARVPSRVQEPKVAARATKQQRTLFQERRPALIGAEKKVIRMLEEMVHTMAALYAKKDNQLLPVFDHLRGAATQIINVVEKELATNFPPEGRDITKPVPFHGLDLFKIVEAINASAKKFEANEDECRFEFDEYLIHPIAHRVVTAINTLEGFQSQPERVLSDKEIEARTAAREAEKAKKEEAAQKLQQKIREREEAAAKKEEEKKILRNLSKAIDVDQLVEDTELPNPSTLGYVQYAPLPLPVEQYELALHVWAMIVSVPRPLMLSQCPFSLFVTALKENKSDNGIMEEVFRSLNDVNIPHANALAPTQGTPKINIRGRDWFSAALEFINLTSGVKKGAKKKAVQESSEEEDSDDSDEDSDDTSSDEVEESNNNSEEDEESTPKGSEEEEEEAAMNDKEPEKPAATVTDPDAHLSPQEKKLKKTMEVIAELRSYASWGNIDVADRLNIIHYLVSYSLDTDAICNEAELLRKTGIDEQQSYDKKIHDTRQEGEKEIRALVRLEAQSKKPVAVGTEPPKPVDFAKKKAQIVANMESLIREARINKFTKADQEDRGARIVPLGQDRYRRLFWRMPLDKFVLVQTVPSLTSSFPVHDSPPELKISAGSERRSLLVDEEEEAPPKKRGRVESNTTTPVLADVEIVEAKQSTWGVIQSQYLPQFVASLDQRGRREGPLKLALQPLEEYLTHLEAPHEGIRMTRSRAAAHGYLNKLRAF